MKQYVLKTKDGETINKVNAEGMFDAIEVLAEIKKLTVDSLISIYDVEVEK